LSRKGVSTGVSVGDLDTDTKKTLLKRCTDRICSVAIKGERGWLGGIDASDVSIRSSMMPY